jgi:hypothetical protein
MDRSTHPPTVAALHYEFDGWQGDELLEVLAHYIVADPLRAQLEAAAPTGCEFAPARVSTSPLFRELYPGRRLPKFHWLRVTGRAGHDDFGMSIDHRLVVSSRIWEILKSANVFGCAEEPFP